MDNQKPAAGGNRIRLFRIKGIQISLDYSWFIILFLITWSLAASYFPHYFPGLGRMEYWAAGIVTAFLFFVSILIHELAHSLVARRCGIPIPEITLFIFGGISRISRQADTPQAELRMAAAGPLTSFALAGLFRGAVVLLEGASPSIIVAVLRYLALINLVLGIFNIIPGFPLDGGRVLRSLLWLKTGSLTRATRTASGIGQFFGLLIVGFGIVRIFSGWYFAGLWLILIGMLLRGLASHEYRELIVQRTLEGMHVKDVMQKNFVSVPPGISVDSLVHDYFVVYGYPVFPVMRGGETLGVVNLADVRGVRQEERPDTPVQAVMRPFTGNLGIAVDATLPEALRRMTEESEESLLVVDQGRVAGLITRAGLFRLLEIKNTPVSGR